MSVDWPVARSVVGLKLRLIRHTPQTLVGILLGLTLGGVLTTAAIAGVVAMRDYEGRAGLLTVFGAVGLLAWLMGPIVLGGGEVILDLRSLAVYPLSLPTLLSGLLLAAFVGVPFLMTTLLALSPVSHARGPASVVILVWTGLQFALTAVLTGRLAVGLVGLLSLSRFRSVAGLITVLFAVVLGGAAQVIPFLGNVFTNERMQALRQVVRLLPIGWTPEAIGQASVGNLGTALGFALAGMSVPVALIMGWRVVVVRLLAGHGAQTESPELRPLVGPALDRFVSPTTAAVLAKSLRALRRDPREWTEVAALLPLILAFTLPNLAQLRDGDPRLVLAVFVAAASGATMVSTNLFGADGMRFTTDAIPGTDMRAVLIGKLGARILPVALIVTAGSLALAWLVQGWRYLPAASLLAVQSMMVGAMSGTAVSIRVPVPMPEKIGSFNAGSAGCITPLFQVAALAVADVLALVAAAAPVVVALFIGPLVATAAAVVTLVVCTLLTRHRIKKEAEYLRNHIPEMVSALSQKA